MTSHVFESYKGHVLYYQEIWSTAHLVADYDSAPENEIPVVSLEYEGPANRQSCKKTSEYQGATSVGHSPLLESDASSNEEQPFLD